MKETEDEKEERERHGEKVLGWTDSGNELDCRKLDWEEMQVAGRSCRFSQVTL